jgi:hypothetical protein
LNRRLSLLTILSLFASICLAVTPRIAAQNAAAPALEQVRALLDSADPKDQAWGAWWVGERPTPELTPVLQRNLASRISGSTWQDEAVTDTTLDALIRTGANDLPFSLIESVYPRRKAQALILLPRARVEPALDAFLLKLMHEKAPDGLGTEWYVAANLLLARRVPGFASAILSDATIQALVVVCDADRPCPPGVFGRRSIGDGIGLASPGFPPWASYELQINPGPRAPVFITGPVWMGYTRFVSREGWRPPHIGESRTQSPSSPSTANRAAYLSALAPDLKPNLQLTIRDEERSVVWQNKAAFDAVIESLQADIRSRYARSIEQLRDAGLLTSEEFAKVSTANVNMRIVDLRAVKTPL